MTSRGVRGTGARQEAWEQNGKWKRPLGAERKVEPALDLEKPQSLPESKADTERMHHGRGSVAAHGAQSLQGLQIRWRPE